VTRRLAGWAAIALAMTACAGPRPLAPGTLAGWYSVEVGDVRLIVQASAPEAAELASDLAGFDAAFAHLLGRRLPAARPTVIHLIRSPELARRFGMGTGVEGWATGTLETSLASVHLTSKVLTRNTLFHEYTHLLLARGRQSRMPRWYNEGLAEYFATLSVRDGAVVVGEVDYQRLQRITAHVPMPLAQLFGERDGTAPMNIGDFYATSWALVHYLLGTPRGRSELSVFEKELSLGHPLDAARERAFGRPFGALESELATHVEYLRRGVSTAIALDARKIAVEQPAAPVPLASAEVGRLLGSLALALDDEGREEGQKGELLALARRLLEAAAREDEENARVHAALAYAQALSGEAAPAAAAIERAGRAAPRDPEVLWRAGQVALATDAPESAELRFREVLALDARFASAWFGLGRALDRRGDADSALAAFGHAREIAWSAALDLEIGRLHLAAGRNAEALTALQPLAHDPHGGRIAERAAELLRDAGLEPKPAQ
jgi:Flp pilus assembly protein TadD